MKKLITYLKTLWSRVADSQSTDVSLDCRLTVGSPSGLDAKLQLNTFVRFVATLVLVLTIGSGNAWGADQTVTWTINGVNTAANGATVNTTLKTSSKSPSTETGVWTAVSTGNSYAGTNGGAQLGSSSYSFQGNITLSGSTAITSSVKIKEIVIKCKSGGSYTIQPKVGGSNFASSQTINSTSVQTKTFTNSTGMTGDIVINLSTSAKKYFNVSSISVTYEEATASLYTITYNRGSGNCATSTWTQTSGGQSTTLPTATPPATCTGWSFAGWCTSSAGSSATNTTSPGSILTGSYTPTDDVTLYAVYTKSGGGGTVESTTTFDWTPTTTTGTSFTQDGITATFAKANGGTAPGYYSTGTAMRLYYKNTLQFEGTSGITIKSVVFTTHSSNSTFLSGVSVTSGSLSSLTWSSINANSATLTNSTTASSGHTRIQKALVTFETSGSTTYYMTSLNCASCNSNPSAGTASLNGSFSLTSVGVTATDWDPGTNCTWDEKGFVWGSSANPTVSNNKVTVNTGTSATWDGALVPSGSTDPTSLSVGNTYHYRAYGKNGKEGATYVYSSDASFTPRSVTCESVTGGTISAGTEVSVSGKTITLTATPDSHFSFGSWTVTNNSTSATITVTNNQFTMPDANVTVTATFNEDAYKTVTFYNNSTNTGITGYTNMKVYVGDTPSEPTLTDGTSGDACDATSDKHYGWSRDTWSGTIDTEAHMTGSPGNHTVYQKGSVPAVVAGDPATISYHAVWAAGSQYWGRLTSSTLSGLATGDRIVIVSTVDGRSGALQSITKTNDNEGVAIAAVPTETNNQISNPSSDIIWTLNANSTNWEIKSGDDKLGSKYTNCPNRVGTGILVQKGTNWTTWTFGSSSSGTDMIYIKNQGTTDCQLGLGIVTASSVNTWRAIKQTTVSSSSDCALKVYKEFGSYSTFLTTCCTTPTLAFAASPYATIRQDIHGASSSTWAEVDVTFTTNSSGTISVPDYGSGKSVYKLSSWEGRGTTGGTLCTTDHAYFAVLTQPSGETPGTGKFHVKTTSGQTGQGTYRIAITQAATDESHGNFCETTVYGFVDVTLRDKFVDNVNDNDGPVNKDGHGAQVATPALSEFGTQVENACHSEGRKLKGWIKETDLQTLYENGTPASTRVQTIDGLCESCDPASDQKLLVVAPGENITTSGATWYAVWAYER